MIIVQSLINFWVSFAILGTKLFSPTKIEFEQPVGLNKKDSYLIISNHKSWLDTFVLMLAFHKKIAFPKFFIKFEMFFIPLIGLVCWALEFPAMRRYSKKYLKKHPEKKSQDIIGIQKYCKKISQNPAVIINFVEGTRFTPEKAKKSNYKNLLNPRAGGLAVILKGLSSGVVGVLNTTIVYSNPNQTLYDFMIRKTTDIKVKVDFIPISDIPIGEYFDSVKDRQIFQDWLNKLWLENDEYITTRTHRNQIDF